MPGGRPTKYNKAALAKAWEYLENHEERGDPVPTAAGLACELGVTKSTLYEWAKHHEEFSNTLASVNQKQERGLTAGGLTGQFQPTIAKLMLANHGYHDKQEIGSSRDMDPIIIRVINADD